MFEKDSCFRLGHISKLHGYKGELSIHLETEDPEEYSELESVFVEYDQKLIPFFLEHIHLQNKGFAIVRFQDIDSEKKAKLLVGCNLFLPLEVLPENAEPDSQCDGLSGYTVQDKSFGVVGKFVQLINLSGNLLLEIDNNGNEILIPKQKEFIVEIDRKQKVIHIDAPKGLLDIYFGEEEE
jgi:16S rRNA processing protein RimM